MAIHLKAPVDQEQLISLKAGDEVLISGTIYTARDAAHKRMMGLIESGSPFPSTSKVRSSIMSGVPGASGKVIGSAGPTTSGVWTPIPQAH